MNIINIGNNDSIKLNENISIKNKGDKYKIDLLKKDKLILIIDNRDCEIIINVYDNFNLLLYGNIDGDINIKINIYNESKLLFNKITKNNKVFEKIEVNLNSNNSKIDYNSTYVGTISSDIFINHNYSNTVSNVVNHALGLKSDMVFNISETVENKIKNCILKQYSKVLKVDNSNTLIRPILNTRDYTVNAFHSSVIANINNDEILYLMSRGITEKESINLIINGFLFSNIKEEIETINNIKEYLNI